MISQDHMKELTPNIRFAVLAVDVACFRIVDKELHVLIGRAPETSPFPGEWALIGGMVRPHETTEDSVARLLIEKAGIMKIYTEQVYTFSKLDRDPRGRVVSVAHLGLTYIDPQDTTKAKLETKWFPVKSMPKLAYDHDEILQMTLGRLRFRVENSNTIKYLMPSEFTLSELQSAYEVVVGESVDKRNFRKRMLGSGMLRDTKKVKKQGVMRPAALYKFK